MNNDKLLELRKTIKGPILVKLGEEEFLTLEYRTEAKHPFIRWILEGKLVVDRPAYGAEELLVLSMLNHQF